MCGAPLPPVPGFGGSKEMSDGIHAVAFPVACQTSGEIDDGGTGSLRLRPILFRVGGIPGKKREAYFVEAVFVEGANKRGLAGGFGERSGHHGGIEQNNFTRREVPLFKNELQFFPAE